MTTTERDALKTKQADRYANTGASKGQLCALYECDYRTLKDWLRPIENELVPYNRKFTPRQVRRIFGHLERP